MYKIIFEKQFFCFLLIELMNLGIMTYERKYLKID